MPFQARTWKRGNCKDGVYPPPPPHTHSRHSNVTSKESRNHNSISPSIYPIGHALLVFVFSRLVSLFGSLYSASDGGRYGHTETKGGEPPHPKKGERKKTTPLTQHQLHLGALVVPRHEPCHCWHTFYASAVYSPSPPDP